MTDLIWAFYNLKFSIHAMYESPHTYVCVYSNFKIKHAVFVSPFNDTVYIPLGNILNLPALYLFVVNMLPLDCKLFEGRDHMLAVFI